MPKSLSHVVVLTNELDEVLRFVAEVANLGPVEPYETEPADVAALFGWPIEHGRARGAFVGQGPGALDVLEIPAALRATVQPGVRLLAIANRDARAARDAATAAGFVAHGPFSATTATGGTMLTTEVIAGGIAFELTQFG
jgi:hypothetical protein